MNKPTIIAITTLLSSIAWAQTSLPPPGVTNASAMPSTISIQEMLVIGQSTMKLHSLTMISQGKAPGSIDESYLPGFKVCSDDPNIPIRSTTARLLGQYFIIGKETPNPEAVTLLMKLARDEAFDVRYNAVYHSITQIKNKSPEIIELLIDVASTDREPGLIERIALSLEDHREEVAQMLDGKLKEGNSIAIYEIYEDLTGKAPADADKYLDMPSSRPIMFVFKGGGENAEAFKSELEAELRSIGLEDPDLFIPGTGKNYVLMLKTYITRDRIAVEKNFVDHEKFTLMQTIWLTPDLEIRFETMRNPGE